MTASEVLLQLENDYEATKRQLVHIGDLIVTHKLKCVKEEFGIEVGSVVCSKRYGLVRVTDIDVRSYKPGRSSKPSVAGNPKKKDGTFGTLRRTLFRDWEQQQ